MTPAKRNGGYLVEELERSFANSTLTDPSREVYRVNLARWEKLTGVATVRALDALEPGDLQRMLDEAAAAEKFSRASIKAAVVTAKSVWRRLRLDKRVRTNPFEAVRFRVGNNVPEGNVLQPGELAKLLAAMDEWTSGRTREAQRMKLLHAVVSMLALHGLRVSELCNLTLGQVHVDREAWVIEFAGKGAKLARMRLKPEAVNSVRRWRKAAAAVDEPTSPLVPYLDGRTKLDRLDVNRWVKQLTKAHLGHVVTPHGLRATFVSDVIGRKGIEAARKLARHSNITTTQRYSRWEVLDDE